MKDAEYLAWITHHYHQQSKESAQSWAEVPDQNKQLMIAVAERLLDGHVQIIKKEAADGLVPPSII